MSVSETAIFAAFPRRSFRVLKSVGGYVFGTFVFLVALLAAFGWVGVHNGIDIARDWQVAGSAKRTQAQLKTKCVVAKAALWECDFEITPATGSSREPREISISFVSFREHRYSATPVASARFPGYVTTDFALEHLVERSWTAGIGALLLALSALGMGRLVAKRWRQWRAYAHFSGQPLKPIPVSIASANKTFLATQYQFLGPDGKKHLINLGRKDGPFYLDGIAKPTALAVVGPDSPIPMLLDERLSRLDFTDVERDALRRARAGAIPAR